MNCIPRMDRLMNLMVPEAGVEPARPEGHRPLKTARLPVPPLRLRGRCQCLVPAAKHPTAAATPRGCPQSGPGRSRTADTPVFSRVLYHLSYRALREPRNRSSLREKEIYQNGRGKSTPQTRFRNKFLLATFKETSSTNFPLLDILTSP